MLCAIGFVGVCLLAAFPPVAVDGVQGMADSSFLQETHTPYTVGEGGAVNDVRAIAVDAGNRVWVATGAGIQLQAEGTAPWRNMLSDADAGPAFDVLAVGDEMVAAVWNGLYRGNAQTGLQRVPGIEAPIAALAHRDGEVIAVGPQGIWYVKNEEIRHEPLPCSRDIRAVMPDKEGGLWFATGMGLYHMGQAGGRNYQREEDILSCYVNGVAYTPDGIVWAAGLGGITTYKRGMRIGAFTPRDGLPSADVRCVACGPDGRMWVGSTQGAAWFDGHRWAVRCNRRWLVNNDVRDIAFDRNGVTWIATANGVSAIVPKQMTLAEKARYFQKVCMERHVRLPFIVEHCRLRTPGDLSTWTPDDDDNDGGYTAVYLVAEALRHAVTGAADAAENAEKAFDTLEFLQTVTETEGFFARTVVPVNWTAVKDGNHVHTPREIAERSIRDPRYKPVDVRWRPSSDGKWLWKGDTSSDEVTAHFFGYFMYYELTKDEALRNCIRSLAKRIMDHIIDGGYVFRDIDGEHTCWGVWAPERLNHDPDWQAERGINSLEILSFLKATYHMTGEARYQKEYERLLYEHHYADNVRNAKTYEPAWDTHIDTELLVMAYPALLLCEDDPVLLALYRASLEGWFSRARNEQNPFASFLYGLMTGKDPVLTEGVFFLRDTPLDLIHWSYDNTQREDVRTTRAPILEVQHQTERVLPPSERFVMRWDKNPWQAIGGNRGATERAPTFWLFPYWLGRYCGYIQGPQ